MPGLKTGSPKIAEIAGKMAEIAGKIAEITGPPRTADFQPVFSAFGGMNWLLVYLDCALSAASQAWIMEGSTGSLKGSSETLQRGCGILQQIADSEQVKIEAPEDEREILKQIQAGLRGA